MKLTVDSMDQSLAHMEGVPIIQGHDPLCLPLGKTEKAWIKYTADNEGLLYNEHYLVSEELPDGPAIKGRNTPARLPPRFPAPGKCTSHLGFGLGPVW